MKKIFISILCLTGMVQTVAAQELYSTTPAGNAVYTFNTANNTVTDHGLLNSVNIGHPVGALVHVGGGVLVGVTINSLSGYGAIYKTDTTTNTITDLYEFTNNNNSSSGFVMANNGKLYTLGITGSVNSNAIYSFDLSNNSYTAEYTITGNSGNPLAVLMKASNGLLYGVTQYGGANSLGQLFSYNTTTSTFTSLYDFNTTNGTEPSAGLIEAANGKLYGVTCYGGTNNKGVLYSFDISTSTYTKLFDFSQPTGETPASPLYEASNGILYGATVTGGANFQGVLYSYNISSNTYTDLHDFWSTEGYGPRTYPIEGTAGVLYGTTNQGGTNFRGSIYSYTIGTSTFTKLVDGDNTTAGNFVSPFFNFYPISVGIAEHHAASGITVFPNPASESLHIGITGNETEFRIADATGRIVLSGSLISETISVSNLAPGFYTLFVSDEDGNTKQARFMKE